MLRSARALINSLRVANPVFRLEPDAPLLRNSAPLSAKDFERSIGNYVADSRGNYHLDLACSSALGHQHPDLLYSALSPLLYAQIAQRPLCSLLPDQGWTDLVRTALMPVAPEGLTDIVLAENPAEGAVKAAIEKFNSKQANGEVIKIGGGIAFPSIRLPYMHFEKDNQKEEARVLAELQQTLKRGNVAGVMVAPITESGNKLASPSFYLSVQDLCRAHNAVFLVDETATGLCITGQFWAFQHWGPRVQPDVVLFGGRMQVSGFFCRRELRGFASPSQGSALNLSMLAAIRKVIHSQRLQKNAEFIGKYLKTRLEGLEGVANVRGVGLYLAFDLLSDATAKEVHAGLLNAGVLLPTPQGRTLTLRPSLTLKTSHADIFLHRLEFLTTRVCPRLASAS